MCNETVRVSVAELVCLLKHGESQFLLSLIADEALTVEVVLNPGQLV